MNRILANIYRVASWGCAGLAWINAGIVCWDGFDGRLQLQYRVVTFVVALIFGLIGGLVFGLERNLGKILRWCIAQSGTQPVTEVAGAWRLVHVLLTVTVAVIFVVMGFGLAGIISRLRQGFTIFG